MKYPDGCSIAIRRVARKMATMEGRLVWFGGGFTAGTLFWTGGLAYDIGLAIRRVIEIICIIIFLLTSYCFFSRILFLFL